MNENSKFAASKKRARKFVIVVLSYFAAQMLKLSNVLREARRPSSWNLAPLTPSYRPDAHSGYVSALETALQDDQVLNIALSGNYGVGKSSILRELTKRLDGRVVELSLSTLAPIEKSNLDDSVPKQATTPTNQIQQEIVKQLLYRAVPGKMPGSRFERIERFKWKRELCVAGLTGIVISVVFLLAGWSAQVEATFQPLVDTELWIHPVILLAGTGVVFGFRRLTYGRIHIKQFTAGSATVTLEEKSVSYFDQYLDEIVHFFEVSRQQDVVIFEDIDRFNNSHIFETLRSLNTLLNGAPQIKKKIRFIYAIKDSIFDKIYFEENGRKLDRSIVETSDPAVAETIRANRTKFFDLVIPVVPFISHRSARNLASRLLEKVDHKVEPEVFDLAAQFVPDMRLLINVRNEFIVFSDRIFAGDGENLDLSQTALYAMMLYKSTHLSDFEAIRTGQSNLDALYRLGRDLVTANIERIESERRALQGQLARLDSIASRSERLGNELIQHVIRTAESVPSVRKPSNNAVTFSLAGANYTEVDLRSVDFWTEFVAAEGDPTIQWNNNVGHTLVFRRSLLKKDLRDPLDVRSWNESDRAMIDDEIAEKTEAIKFLRSADMGALIQRPEFQVDYDGEPQSLDTVAHTLLGPGLAYQLVRAGFIDRDFTLYTSTFHGDRLSTASTNFIIHHVERDSMDFHFKLKPDEVDMVIRERGPAALKDSAFYNIPILNHLLASDPDIAKIMVGSLASFGENQRQFLQAYLEDGHHREELIEYLTPLSTRVLTYLVNEAKLDESQRHELVDSALANLAADTKYRTDEATSAYLLDHYADFSSVYSDDTTASQSTRIADLFAVAGVSVPTLAPSRVNLRRELVARNLYQITLSNLITAVGRGVDLGLDSLAAENETIYEYCLADLPSYLRAIDEDKVHCSTVDAAHHFAGVIEDILERGNSDYIGHIVSGASKECFINSLSEVAPGAWTALAKYKRFPSTLENATMYIETAGSIDNELASLLAESGEISATDDAEENAKEALAQNILNADPVLLSSELRVQLVVSLNLKNYLDIDDVPAEKGELFALLLKHTIIADDPMSYERLSSTDWPTREAFIQMSRKFPTYASPKHVGVDLAEFLVSEKVNEAAKQSVLERADEFAEAADIAGLSQLAKFAIQQKKPLSEELVLAMAQAGVSTQSVVQLLALHLADISTTRLFSILEPLGQEYAKLTSVGHDRPRIPNTAANQALLDRLKRDGIVNSYNPSATPIKVYKKLK